MIPAGVVLASGFTIMMIVAWIQQLREEWRQQQAREQAAGLQNRLDARTLTRTTLIINPDCEVKMGAHMGRRSPQRVPGAMTRVQAVRRMKQAQNTPPRIMEVDLTSLMALEACDALPMLQGLTKQFEVGSGSMSPELDDSTTESEDDSNDDSSVEEGPTTSFLEWTKLTTAAAPAAALTATS